MPLCLRRAAVASALALCLATAAHAGAPSEKPWLHHLLSVPVNGTSLPVLDSGKGTPIVLLHGAAEDWRTWLPVLGPLSSHGRVVAYSRRHFHPNPPSAATKDLTAEASERDLLGVLDALKLPAAHFVGHGSGAALAMAFAAAHPERVTSLTLVEPDLPEVMKGTQADSAYVTERRLVREQIRMTSQDGFPDLALEHVLEWSVGPTALQIVPHWVQAMMESNQEALRLEVAYGTSPHVGREQFRTLRCPVLVIDGQDSPPFAQTIADQLLKARPATERVTLKHSGYAAPWTDSKDFDKAVREFLHRHPTGEAPKPLAGD